MKKGNETSPPQSLQNKRITVGTSRQAENCVPFWGQRKRARMAYELQAAEGEREDSRKEDREYVFHSLS